MNNALLSVRDLRVGFKGDSGITPVLHGISFDIAAGETLAVVGESGSGKSVTALCAMGLLDPRNLVRSGEIRFADQDLLTLDETAMAHLRGNRIAMIFQEPMTSLNPILTIGEQICEVLEAHRGLSRSDAAREAIALMELVRIPDAARRLKDYPHNFSGGMRQRVMIAISLACEPDLLIADEPTTALDVTIQAEILELLRQIKAKRQLAILFITHDMGVVAEIADRVVVMYRGNIVEEGPTQAIFTAPAQPYTRALLGAVPRLGSMEGETHPRQFPVIDIESSAVIAAPIGAQTVKADTPPALDVRHLKMRFDIRTGLLGRVKARVHAVEDVSFHIQPGETLSLIGESGCGKSTIGRTILGMNPGYGGEILLNDRVLGSRRSLADRRDLQMVFQDPFASLDPRFTLGASIAEPLLLHKVENVHNARLKAGDLLETVGLSREMLDRYPHQLSGGQRQRVCIARAIALEPKVIVADEAVSALDVTVKAQVINLLLDLQARLGLAYLFISHDMAVVERVSHRVAVMYMGEIVETGPRAAVFANPTHPYTKKLLAAVPVPDPTRRPPAPAATGQGPRRSPLRAHDYIPPARSYSDCGAGHLVQNWDQSWEISA